MKINNDNIIYYFNEKTNGESSSKVMSIIEDCFKKSNLKIDEIDKIFVVNGPGSFTGIRIGVTIAKIIGYCLNKPIIPISELELLASKEYNVNKVSLIDARRGYVFGAIYDKDLNVIEEESHILLSDLEQKYPKEYKIVTEDNQDIDLLRIIKKHEMDKETNPHELKPNYLKNTEAEEKLND